MSVVAPDVSKRLVVDRFDRPIRRGAVVGSTSTDGNRRVGIDREGVMEVDHGALRIHTMVTPGWGRTGLVHGPFERSDGLALFVHVLNGHNTSDSSAVGTTWRRVARWATGSGTEPIWRRALRYPASRQREWLPRKLRYWWANRDVHPDPLLENLMVGWFGDAAPSGPLSAASAHVVRATGPHNGELTTTVSGSLLPSFRGLQNLPVRYASILREHGAVHYAASDYAGARGLPHHPAYRPIAIDPRPLPDRVYGGLHQGSTGQIGFSCDTRVYGIDVVANRDWQSWCTTAVVADRFSGPFGPVATRRAERGGDWRPSGRMTVDRDGLGLDPAATPSSGALQLPHAPAPPGLIHLVVDGVEAGETVGVRWRERGPGDHWELVLDHSGALLQICSEGVLVHSTTWPRPLGGGPHAVQISDEGQCVAVAVDGVALGTHRVIDDRSADGLGLGLLLSGVGRARVRELEAHPRHVVLDGSPSDDPPPPVELGDTPVVDERFATTAADLSECRRGDAPAWHRLLGSGRIEVVAPGRARFAASAQSPVPGRTIYAIDWDDERFCDLELRAQAPTPIPAGEDGARRCRAGVAMWQDPNNYFAVNIYLDEAYPAASASTFFTFRGFEDVYDAVWSNLGDLVSWDEPFRLRLVCDGRTYVALVNDEPVLHRAFSDVHPSTERLAIRKAGIVAAWEWGLDTGSSLHRFIARTRPDRPGRTGQVER